MPTVALTAENFEAAVEENPILLVDFWAGWCAPCLEFAEVYEEAAQRHPDLVFGTVDTDAQPDLTVAFDASSIPLLVAFRDGIIVFSGAGALYPPQLEDVIEQVRALDMEQVRRDIADYEAAIDAYAEGGPAPVFPGAPEPSLPPAPFQPPELRDDAGHPGLT